MVSSTKPSHTPLVMGAPTSTTTTTSLAILLLLLVFCVLDNVQGNDHVAKGCDVSQGRWVYNASHVPPYSASNCSFIEMQFDCLKYGRPDQDYLKYTWQPKSCNLPRFNGRELLRKLKGKNIMFVGDSLSLNQWQSLACMLHTAAPEANYSLVRTGGLSTFTFPAYSVKIMMSRNAFLVDIVSANIGPVLKLDSVEEAGKLWDGTDVLVFNSWHWWLHRGQKQPWKFVEAGNKTYHDIDRLVAYEKALKTWATWVETNVNPARTKVFFQGVSPDHSNGSYWGEPSANSCVGETEPVEGSKYPSGSHPAEVILERVLSGMSKPVHLLNVTTLSQLRKDGHPSMYGRRDHRGTDCSHWCLPGVPDTWNQLLYGALFNDSS